MRYKSKINRLTILIIFSLFILNISCRIIKNAYDKSVIAKNQIVIDQAINQLMYAKDSYEHDLRLLLPLLDLRHLSEGQLAQIYLLVTTLHYSAGNMDSYFKDVGKALFYSKRTNNTDSTIYLYANMAKYFLEINGDQEAFDIINEAASFGSFYECSNVLTRIHIFQVYSAYLLHIRDYDRAFLAAHQIISDAPLTESFSPFFPVSYERAGNAIKALILLEQGKVNEAYVMACSLFEKYADPKERITQFNAFDFYMPLYYIKAIWALNHQEYQTAIEACEEYGKLCDDNFFIQKKIMLIGRLMNGLPPSMAEERSKLFQEISIDSRRLSAALISENARLSKEKFSGIMNELVLDSEIKEKTKDILHVVLVNFIIVALVFILFYVIFSEMQLDGLTKLYNRRTLNSRIHHLDMAKKNYTAVMLDLDDFKKLNDTYGHAFGDEVLKSVSSAILEVEGRFIKAYRYGGEEIVVLFEHLPCEDVIRMSESIRNKVCRLKFSKDVRVTASFGVGARPGNPVKQADENLYYAKSKGKNITAYKIDGKQYLAERRLEIRNPMPDTK